MSVLERLADPEFLEYVAEKSTPEERARFTPLLKQEIDNAKRLRLQPKQQLAETRSHECDALLYGGAAGGGKTHWLLIHATKQMLDHPGNRGVIFRRVFPSLNRTIIPRAIQLLKPWATYNKVEHVFTFHNGSVLECASLQREADVEDYQGAEYGFIGFEEITEFLESQVDYFKSRLRAPVAGVHPHIAGTTNPGGVGHKWVKREWVRPEPEDVVDGKAEPGEVWSARPKGEEPPMKRCFVPATIEDNPALLERDPEYRNRLKAMKNAKKRKAYEKGDWDAIEEVDGALWQQNWLDEGRVYEMPTVNRRIIAIDPSDGDKKGDGFGVVVASLCEDGEVYIEFSEEWHNTPGEMTSATIDLYYETGAGAVVIEKNHGGKWIPALFENVDSHVNTKLVWASDGKMSRAEPVAAYFQDLPTQARQAHLVGNHPELEDELTNFTGKPGQPSPDILDAMVWAVTELMILPKQKPRMVYRG